MIGSSSGLKPVDCFGDDKVLLRKHWMKSHQIANLFWKRCVREYLPTITRRSKWIEPAKPNENEIWSLFLTIIAIVIVGRWPFSFEP